MTRVFLAVLFLVALLALTIGPFVDELPSGCAFRYVTGEPCVFCGMSHAVTFAVYGDFAAASNAHRGWFIVLPLFALFVAAMVRKQRQLSWMLVGVFVVGTIVRAIV